MRTPVLNENAMNNIRGVQEGESRIIAADSVISTPCRWLQSINYFRVFRSA